MGRCWVVVHLQSGESVGRGCQIHPAITCEVIARNRHIARIWPKGVGAEVSRAECNPYPKLKSPRIGPLFFGRGPNSQKNEMRYKMSEF